MYCFTYVNGLTCVLNELLLWSEISKEHPVFILTVAKLTNKNLPEDVKNSLNSINEMFDNLNKKTKQLNDQLTYNSQMAFQYIPQVKALVDEFLQHDTHFINLLPFVKQYGKDDAVWQELLEHIEKEQKFMFELFNNIKIQLSYY